MKKLFLLLTITTILFSCSSDSNNSNNNNPTTNIPIGTTVKLEASISSGSTIQDIYYKDGQGNYISLENVPNNWTTTYQITADIDQIWLNTLVGAGQNGVVTGKIYINGVLMRNASANYLWLYYP